MSSSIRQLLPILPLVLIGPLSMDMYLPALPSIADAFATTNYMAQLTLSLFVLFFGICQLFCGEVAVRLGRARTIYYAVVGYVVATAVCFATTDIIIFIIGRCGQALTSCACLVLSMAMVRDSVTCQQESAKHFSLISGATAIAPLLAPLIGAYLMWWFVSWRAVFFCLLLLSVVAFAIFVSYQPTAAVERKSRTSGGLSDYLTIIRDPEFWQYAVISAGGMGIIFTFFSMAPHLFMTELGLTRSQFSLIFGGCASFFLLGSLLNSRLLKKCGVDVLIMLCFGGILLSALVMFLWPLWFTSVSSLLIPLGVIELSLGLVFGPTIAAALQPFKGLADQAASVHGFQQFVSSTIVGTVIMMAPNLGVRRLGLGICIIVLLSVLLNLLFSQLAQKRGQYYVSCS